MVMIDASGQLTDNCQLVKRRSPRTTQVLAAVLAAHLLVLASACSTVAPATSLEPARPSLAAAAQTAVDDTKLPESSGPSITSTAVPTDIPLQATMTVVGTNPAPASATAFPTTVPTLTPVPSLTPTIVPSATPEPSPTTEPGRYCPETPPLKPEYSRFYLSGEVWPRPDEAIAEPHFWMGRPLPGAGRVLINQRFPYGWDENGRFLLHNGVDIAEDLGTDVVAVADGTVVVAQSDYSAWYGWRCDWYGHLVVIELDERWQDQPLYALYGHVLNLKVEAGERVTRGEPVAEVGFGGAATNPHLHFEVRVGENEFGSTRNPMLWLDPGPTRGVVVGRLVDPQGRPWQGVLLALVSDANEAEIIPGWSYLGDPQNLMNPDEGWAENFVFSDVPPGSYQVITEIQGNTYQAPVVVSGGQVSVIEIVTEPLVETTPTTPEVADTPAAAGTPAGEIPES